MINKYILIIIASATLSLTACNFAESPSDAGALPQKEIADMLYDMALLEGIKAQNINTLRDMKVSFKEYVFRTHGVDSLKFAHSMDYYARHPKLLAEVYKRVLIKLNKKQEKLISQ